MSIVGTFSSRMAIVNRSIIFQKVLQNSSWLHGSTIEQNTSRSFFASYADLNGSSSSKSDNSNDALLSKEEKSRLNKIQEELEKNTYFDKYKAKLMQAQKSAPKQFLALLEERLGTKIFGKQSQSAIKFTKPKKLDDVMKMSLLDELTKEELVYIWREYHKSNNQPSAIVPFGTYEALVKRAEQFKTFVLPIERKGGHENMLVQYDNDCFYFTPLIAYRVYKENAPACLTIMNFTELAHKRGIVLMRGEFDSNVINLKEAQLLAVQIHLYYAIPSDFRLSLLKKFSKNPEDFDHIQLIAHLKEMKSDNEEFFPSKVENSK